MRSTDLRRCSNMKEIHEKADGDGELKAAIQSSLKNVTGLIEDRFEKLGNLRNDDEGTTTTLHIRKKLDQGFGFRRENLKVKRTILREDDGILSHYKFCLWRSKTCAIRL